MPLMASSVASTKVGGSRKVVIRNLKMMLRTETNSEHAAICKRHLTVINSLESLCFAVEAVKLVQGDCK